MLSASSGGQYIPSNSIAFTASKARNQIVGMNWLKGKEFKQFIAAARSSGL